MTKNVINLKVTPSSSLVEFLEFDQHKRELIVKFKRGKYKGKERKYADISKSAFMNLLESDSVGKSVLKLVKGKKGTIERKTFFSRIFA